MNKDQIDMVPAHQTVRAAYAQLDGGQDNPPAQQVMGQALLFRETCRGLGLDPSEMLDKAERVARHAEDHYSIELQALRQYVREVLR